MSFVRTVLGDIDASALGVCYAHEHIVIDDCFTTEKYPEFRVNDVEKIAAELRDFHAAGGRAMVDSMPGACGRNAVKLAKVSRGAGVHILAPTGVHLAKYYPPGHWSQAADETSLTEYFVREIESAIEDPAPAPHRAGLIKVASGADRLTDQQKRIFRAAAMAQCRTGAPILTHTEQGTAAMEQIEALASAGADLSHVVLSHLDRKPVAAYHREALRKGVKLEYDSAFRWTQGNPTLDLLAELLPEFPDQIMLGMDAAKASYWKYFGGKPGLAYLLTEFTKAMLERGIDGTLWEKVFVHTPRLAYAFARGHRR